MKNAVAILLLASIVYVQFCSCDESTSCVTVDAADATTANSTVTAAASMDGGDNSTDTEDTSGNSAIPMTTSSIVATSIGFLMVSLVV